MDCPNCGRALREAEYEGALIHTCESCGGEFVGSVELAYIVSVREERFGPALHGLVENRAPIYGVLAEATQRSLGCPACGNAMQQVNYATDTGIYVDRCPTCGGIWLDHEELEKVQALLEKWDDEAAGRVRAIAGELEAARRRAATAGEGAFAGSRFSFINAVINRILDAA